jgi:hypothetical protein
MPLDQYHFLPLPSVRAFDSLTLLLLLDRRLPEIFTMPTGRFTESEDKLLLLLMLGSEATISRAQADEIGDRMGRSGDVVRYACHVSHEFCPLSVSQPAFVPLTSFCSPSLNATRRPPHTQQHFYRIHFLPQVDQSWTLSQCLEFGTKTAMRRSPCSLRLLRSSKMAAHSTPASIKSLASLVRASLRLLSGMLLPDSFTC